MAGQVFISYSHVDRSYVRRLERFLGQADIPAWWDHAAMSGERFAKVIQDELDRCVAVVVVLTPAALDSIWVHREMDYAAAKNMPILPLMLRRCPVPIVLAGLQYEDVTGDRMPPRRFVSRLQALVGGRRDESVPPEKPSSDSRPVDAPWRTGFSDPWAAICATAVALVVDGAVWLASDAARPAAISAVAGAALAYFAYVAVGVLKPR